MSKINDMEISFDFLRSLKDIAIESGVTFAFIINPNDLIFDSRTQIKCRFCKRYGKKATCPPNIPPMSYFKELVKLYRFGILIGINRKSTKPKVGTESSISLHKILLDLEAQSFMNGYVFVTSFIGGSCKHCATNTCEAPCKNPVYGRIPLEAIGVNVIDTCRQFNIEVEFPVEKTGVIWRIGLLLVM